MSNWRLIIKVLGILLFIEAGIMAVCFFVGMYYEESAMYSFLWPIIISMAIGGVNQYVGKDSGTNMSRRDGYIIVTVVWILFSFIGMLPFLFSGAVPDMSSAFFESMSGFTSTGATIIDDCDSQPHCILMWRSITQWVGGIGIIFFTVAILPAFGVGEVKLFAAESTGPLKNKVHPRISITAKWIGTVYILLTSGCIISLLLCGMGGFDAVNYSMVITGTGGYGTHSALLHDAFNSPTIEYVMTFFMIMSGINYTLIYYTILRGRVKRFFQDSELRCFLFIFITAAVSCTVGLMAYRIYSEGVDVSSFSAFFSQLELSFREALFTVVSLQTTTGLATCDYTIWPVALMPILLFVMFAGACSGSTSGGFKCIRWSIIYRVTRNEFKRILHPRAVLPVKYNGQVLNNQIVRTLFGFVALFVGCLFGGAFVLALFGVDPNHQDALNQGFDYYEAFGIAMSSLSNVGPGMGYYGPTHSWAILSPFAKYVCSFLMLIGRLEIFPVLVILTRSFWKKT
mgnify:CR=1 FL=1